MQTTYEAIWLLRVALPDREDTPAVATQGSCMAFVAGGVAFELFPPPSRPCLGNPSVFAIPVQMPEAAMDKNADAMAWQNDVGTTWQVAPVQPKTIAHRV